MIIENACGGITGRSPEIGRPCLASLRKVAEKKEEGKDARRLLGLFNWESLPEKDEEGDKAEEGSQSEPP